MNTNYFFKTMFLSAIALFAIATVSKAVERIGLFSDEPAGASRQEKNIPIIVGSAIPKGALTSLDNVRVVNADGTEVLCQLEAACYWDTDKSSIKWLLADVPIGLKDSKMSPLFLEYGPEIKRKPIKSPLNITSDDSAFIITTGKIEVVVMKHSFNLFERVRRDNNGDGQYTQDEEIIKASADSGLFWVDQNGVRYDSRRDKEIQWEVEKRGPMRITLKGEGWFVSKDSKKQMKQITRMRFHPDSDFVRVYQTFIWTAGKGTDVKQITLSSKMANNPKKTTFGLDGKIITAESDVNLLQDSYRTFSWQGSGKTGVGTRGDGWIESLTPAGSVLAIIRDCAQQQPKGFAVENGQLLVHLYPPHKKLLSTAEDARLTRMHHQNPSWAAGREYSFDPNSGWRYEPIGFAKTHEIVYQFPPASSDANAAVHANDFVQRPVVVYADPAKVCQAKPLGFYIPKKDITKWPRYEQLLDTVYRWGTKYDEELENFEIFNFGDVIWGGNLGRSAMLYRYWGNQCKGFVNTPWYLFMRSGDRYYAQRGLQHAVHVMDVDTVSYGADSGGGMWPRVIGSQWVYSAVHFGWCTVLLGLHTQYDYLYYCYYLTGYERAQEMARKLEKSVLATGYENFTFHKKNADGKVVPFDPDKEKLETSERITAFCRPQYGSLWQLSVMGINSCDRRFRKIVDRWEKVAVLNRNDKGCFLANYMNLAQSQLFSHILTGDDSAAKAIVEHARNDQWKNTFSSMIFPAYAYELTKDNEFLTTAVSNLDMYANTIDLGDDWYNRGAFHGANQAANDQFFLGSLMTMGHLETNQSFKSEALRGLRIDGGPTDVNTGPATGKYLRVAYVLEQNDVPIHIDFDFKADNGYLHGQNIDIQIIDPQGKMVAEANIVPHNDKEGKSGTPSGAGADTFIHQCRLDVPADNLTGVYKVRISGQHTDKKRYANGLIVTAKSSTGKLVYYIPTPSFRISGRIGGRLWFEPKQDAKTIAMRQLAPEIPYVVRLFNSKNEQVGIIQSIKPDASRSMYVTVNSIDVPVNDKNGLWSFTAGGEPWNTLEVSGTRPFYSMSQQEWFDPLKYGIIVE